LIINANPFTRDSVCFNILLFSNHELEAVSF
jgi:hypothetical protein